MNSLYFLECLKGYTRVKVGFMSVCIRESVDSLCRDGTDTPYTQYKIKVFKSLQKITFKLSKAPNLHFRGCLQPTRLPKSPKSFVKVENWTAVEIPVCSCSNNSSTRLAQNRFKQSP